MSFQPEIVILSYSFIFRSCSLWFCKTDRPNPKESCMARVKPQYKESTMTKKRVKWHLGWEMHQGVGWVSKRGHLSCSFGAPLICFPWQTWWVTSSHKDLVVAFPRLQLRFEDTDVPSSSRLASLPWPSDRIQWFMLYMYLPLIQPCLSVKYLKIARSYTEAAYDNCQRSLRNSSNI